jgi:hypothetical protein
MRINTPLRCINWYFSLTWCTSSWILEGFFISIQKYYKKFMIFIKR